MTTRSNYFEFFTQFNPEIGEGRFVDCNFTFALRLLARGDGGGTHCWILCPVHTQSGWPYCAHYVAVTIQQKCAVAIDSTLGNLNTLYTGSLSNYIIIDK